MTTQEKINLIEELVADVISELKCKNPSCRDCSLGIELGESGIPCINKAYHYGLGLQSNYHGNGKVS
jgi:hypothetical protein